MMTMMIMTTMTMSMMMMMMTMTTMIKVDRTGTSRLGHSTSCLRAHREGSLHTAIFFAQVSHFVKARFLCMCTVHSDRVTAHHICFEQFSYTDFTLGS